MKKPSERIKELSYDRDGELEQMKSDIYAIIKYLDELQEQQKTSHDEIDELLRDRLNFKRKCSFCKGVGICTCC